MAKASVSTNETGRHCHASVEKTVTFESNNHKYLFYFASCKSDILTVYVFTVFSGDKRDHLESFHL